MNFIAHDRACCSYPLPTLEDGAGLLLQDITQPHVRSAIELLTGHGYRVLDDCPSLHSVSICARGRSSAIGRELGHMFSKPRTINDGHSWTIRLPLEGVDLPRECADQTEIICNWVFASACKDVEHARSGPCYLSVTCNLVTTTLSGGMAKLVHARNRKFSDRSLMAENSSGVI